MIATASTASTINPPTSIRIITKPDNKPSAGISHNLTAPIKNAEQAMSGMRKVKSFRGVVFMDGRYAPGG